MQFTDLGLSAELLRAIGEQIRKAAGQHDRVDPGEPAVGVPERDGLGPGDADRALGSAPAAKT